MTPVSGEPIEIRVLNAGNFDAGEVQAFEGSVLKLTIPAAAISIVPGRLVEARTGRTIYLGEIKAREGAIVTVAIEHALDRETLAQIQQAWRRY